MSTFRLCLLSLGLLVWTTGFVRAEAYPTVVQHALKPGAEVIRTFSAPGGMTGYVVTQQGQRRVMYLTADQQYLIIGEMLDEQGNNLSQVHLGEYLPLGYVAFWDKAEQATWIAEGAKEPKRVVYVIVDPYCRHCHALWRASQPYLKLGLQLRWLLIAYLHPDSETAAAAILEAADPEATMKRHHEAALEGRMARNAKPKPETLQAIRANGRLLQEFGVKGTPALLYQDADGKAQLTVGMPKLGDLPDIFRLPE